jgi:hypothetical protein
VRNETIYHEEQMRTETVEEYLKRGGKVTKLEKELNTINGAYKTYDATSPATKEGRWGIYANNSGMKVK